MIAPITTKNKAIISITNINAPDIPRDPASCKIEDGKRETIPIMINMDIPFPIPLSVIFSPSHIAKIQPVTKIITEDGEVIEGDIATDKKYRENELGELIKQSVEAKEMCRKAFSIPDMPDPETTAAVEQKNKSKRKRKPKLESDIEN